MVGTRTLLTGRRLAGRAGHLHYAESEPGCGRRQPCERAGAAESAGGEEGPEADDAAWRDADGQLPLAARQGHARREGVSRRRERLHRGGHKAHRGAAGDALQGDARTDQGVRRAGARARTTATGITRAPRRGRPIRSSAARRASPDAPEEVFLDQNALAEGKKFHALGGLDVSPDGTKLIYLEDLTAFREYTLYVKDLATGKILDRSRTCGTAPRGPTTTRRSST